MMSAAELQTLADDIREHGLRDPIILHDDLVLDGRNRLRACEIAATKPRFACWSGGDPVAFVISANLHRRHLNESQRAMIAARIATLKSGQRADLMNQKQATEISVASAAKLLKVSDDLVSHARVVMNEGRPADITAIEQGTARVSSVAKRLRQARISDQSHVARLIGPLRRRSFNTAE